MCYSIICMILASTALVQGQPSFQLQFLGTEISEAEQSNFDFCENEYCLLDADYLFTATTQNKSIRPCEDFEEFALGNLIKYRAISDRTSRIGFEEEQNVAFKLRLKRVLSEKINDKDIAVTKSIKQFYSKCVNSDYVRRNGVKEMREYLATLGLKFYPEIDQNNFQISKYFELDFDNAVHHLLGAFIRRRVEDGDQLVLSFYGFPSGFPSIAEDLRLSGIEEILYEMFQVYLNNSVNVKIYKQEFHQIATNLIKTHKVRDESYTNIWPTKRVTISFEELNNLTSKLNIDWLKLIPNKLLTNITADERILVDNPSELKNIIDFLVSVDLKLIADFLAYDFILRNSELVEVYQSSNREIQLRGTKRSAERWDQCIEILKDRMGPALMFLYSTKYRDEKQENAAQEFINEAKEFAMRKIKKESNWNETFNEKAINHFKSLKAVVGYPDMVSDAQTIQEVYADLKISDDQSLVQMNSAIKHFYRQQKRALVESKFKEIYAIDHNIYLSFQSSFYHDSAGNKHFDASYLHYPFYHNERPRFFNSATLAQRFFREVKIHFQDLESSYDDSMFKDSFQVGYEFYDDWLKSGGKDLQLGAHRLSDRQLYWIAAARVFYSKLRVDRPPQQFGKLHERYLLKPGFREAFHCSK